MDESLEARVERLEDFIGNIDQIRLYANSLQEVIDKYLAPLYIESGSGKTMLIDGYLGDLEHIPHNIIFKIRASHDLVMQESDEQALIRFKRGEDYVEYTLRKIVDNVLTRLDSSNYIAGEVYDIYIDSQDVAIITASDTGVRALSEVAALAQSTSDAITRLEGQITTNYNTLDARITTTSSGDRTYTDTKVNASNTRISALEAFISPITKSDNNYTFPGNVTVGGTMQTTTLRATNTINFSGASGFVLPSGTTIADPSSNLAVANRQWVTNRIETRLTEFYNAHHYVGTTAASTAMSGKENGSFYYKLSQ